MPFKKPFAWGVASASYQIEGAAGEDGKGKSIWDVYSHTPGKIFHGHTGDVACDHYRRWKEDVALMKGLGVNAYRFSVSWPRVLPAGTGKLNPKGLAFYDKLVDSLLEAGIQPWLTLFHWDYPHELFLRGGWLNPDSPAWFAEYSAAVASALGDRVRHWMTMNETICFTGGGLYDAWHAPGLKLPLGEAMQAVHNVLLAHGDSVKAIRASAKADAKIGIALCGPNPVPFTESPADIEAARKSANSAGPRPIYSNSWWHDPIFLGKYPEDGLAILGKDAPKVLPGDMERISQDIDFCGTNIYSGDLVKAGPGGEPETVLPPPGFNRTAQDDWFVNPPSLYWKPKFLYERYGKPVIITENGHQNLDSPSLDGKVHDPQRIDYLHRYLLELERAIDDGVKVDGYFLWTLMDNFEWAAGYKVRVGLVYTDFQTLQRIPKDSYAWYKQVIATNGASLHS